MKEYIVEISFTRTKLMIIVSRRRYHYKTEFPIVQGKKIINTLGGSLLTLAGKLRLSSTKTLYVENLHKILYPRGEYYNDQLASSDNQEDRTPDPKSIKYLQKIEMQNYQTPHYIKKAPVLDYSEIKKPYKTPMHASPVIIDKYSPRLNNNNNVNGSGNQQQQYQK